MKINFEFQLDILEKLKEFYPRAIFVEHVFPDQREDGDFIANCIYLNDHKLIELPQSQITNEYADIIGMKLTTKGYDFLEPNGGMTALLNTMTIKFDAEQLREILLASIESNEPDKNKKIKMREIVKELKIESIKALFLHLSAKGLEHLPDVYQLLQKCDASVESFLV